MTRIPAEFHGQRKTRFYTTWTNMKSRCLNKNTKCYHRYGGIGVDVSKEWITFSNFWNDMHESYLEHCEKHGIKQTTLDRIDPYKGYSKENCRWATPLIQALNQRKRRGEGFYQGVYKQGNKWNVMVSVNGKYRYFGIFKTPEEANVVAEKVIKERFDAVLEALKGKE